MSQKKDARVGKRFSAAAYEILGDYSIGRGPLSMPSIAFLNMTLVQEYVVNVYDSPWGQTFHAHAESVLSACSDAELISRLAFVQMGKPLSSVRPRYKYGRASSVANDQCDLWIEARQVFCLFTHKSRSPERMPVG